MNSGEFDGGGSETVREQARRDGGEGEEEDGAEAVAMTDHGNVFGAYDFYRQAKAHGVKPIIGMEAYLTPKTHRTDRTRVKWAEGGEDDVEMVAHAPHQLEIERDDEVCILLHELSPSHLVGPAGVSAGWPGRERPGAHRLVG